MYTGSITISVAGSVIKTIPLSLTVYNFTIPDETHLHNMFYYERCFIAARHGVDCGSDAFYAIEGKYHQMAHRHRMDLICMVWDLKILDKGYKRTLTGQLYTPSFNYQGPGEGIGNRTFSIEPYGELPGEWGGDAGVWTESAWRTGSNAWETWFETNAPLVERHRYLDPDEPKTAADYARIIQQSQWTTNNPGSGNKIPCYVTDYIHNELKGYVDYWSISADHFKSSYQQSAAVINAEVAAGHKWGVYNGYRPAFGSVLIDADAIEFRVMPWILWKYQANQYYYFSTTYWQGDRFNLFQDPYTYGSGKYAGDGTFFYPGQDTGFTNENRNLPGPLSSLRMKNWRRGMQDYEYLWLANEAGLKDSAKAIANACVPRALWDADYTRDIPWSIHGYGFEVFRKRLAELLSRQNSTTMLRYNNVDAHIKNRAVVHPTLYINQKNGSPVVRIHCAGNRVFDFRGALVANVRANAYQ